MESVQDLKTTDIQGVPPASNIQTRQQIHDEAREMIASGDYTQKDVLLKSGITLSLYRTIKKELVISGRELSLTHEQFAGEVEVGLAKGIRRGLVMIKRGGKLALSPSDWRSVCTGLGALIDRARLLADQSTSNVKTALHALVQRVDREKERQAS